MLGGNGGFPRRLAIALGGFDEQILAGGTEVDFTLRAFECGTRLVHCPDAVIGYRIVPGAMAAVGRELRRSRGRAYLGRRHRGRYGMNRRIDPFVRPWIAAASTLLGVVRRRESIGALVIRVTNAMGISIWSAWFLIRRPHARLGLADLQETRVV